jgi:hypothetical protein
MLTTFFPLLILTALTNPHGSANRRCFSFFHEYSGALGGVQRNARSSGTKKIFKQTKKFSFSMPRCECGKEEDIYVEGKGEKKLRV